MVEVLVWILVSTSNGYSNQGTLTVIDRFKTEQSCQHVKDNLPKKNQLEAKCIQANILVSR